MNNERETQKLEAIVGFILTVITLAILCAVIYFNGDRAGVVETEVSFPVEEVTDEIIEVEAEVEEVVAEVEAEEEEEVVEEEVVTPAAETISYQTSYEPAYSGYTENGSGLTKSGGVNWHNGRRETWYSSNDAYHYRTGEWTVGEDGVYRDADGYVVVAASDLAQGSTVSTSFGEGKVYDTGCAAGTTDIYVAW